MTKQPTPSEWIDFLYGELPENRKSDLEAWLDSHPEDRLRLEEMQQTLGILPAVADKEVLIPSLPVPADFGSGRGGSLRWWRTWYSVAATLLLLMMTAWLTGLSIGINQSGLHIGFAPFSDQRYTPEQVEGMIDAAISRAMDQQALLQSPQVPTPVDKRTTDASAADVANLDQALAAYVRQMKAENRQTLQELVQLNQEDQRLYMEQVLSDFSEYLLNQRQQDLYAIQTYLTGLQQNTEQFQLETEQILAALIRTTEILPGDRQ